MIDLTKYGFVETRKDTNWTEYENDTYRITIFDYLFKTFGGAEIHIRKFNVNTKQTTSMAFPLEELEAWLKEKNINPIS